MNIQGFDRTQYWILLRLFRTLSDRREMTGQVGMDPKTMKTMQFWYVFFGGLISLSALGGRIPGAAFLAIVLGATVFVLVPILVSEAANAFMNPAEAFVLAHQPIRGGTFIAAKATYILLATGRVVLSLNAIPALAGLALKDTTRIYPITHLLSASLTGLFTALVLCGMFGILFRMVPISRLRNAARWMQLMMALLYPVIRFGQFLPWRRLLPAHLNLSASLWSSLPPTWFIVLGLIGQPGRPAFSLWYALPVMAASALFIAYGARSLSQDYMTRVVLMMRGEKTGRRRVASGDWFARIARRLTGRPSGRAAYSYVTKMAVRDWQFRRLTLQGLFPIFFLLFQAVRNGKIAGSPFQQGLASAHFVPHLVGYVLMTVCVVMAYSDQYKSAWIFLTVPMAGIRSFVRGIYWSLWLPLVLTPHIVVLAIGFWLWGLVSALTFTAYSLAVSSLYLSATLRLLEGLPFAAAPKARAGRVVGLPLILTGMAVCGICVALQYFFIFRSLAITAAVALIAAATAVALARNTLRGIETNVLHNLHVLASGSSRMFQELDTESQES